MMSVHKAKGLEFPVVIMADITAKICRQYPSRHIDSSFGLCAIPLAGCEPLDLRRCGELELGRDRAEGIRLAYVAATRARELLVVPTIGDDPRQSWDSAAFRLLIDHNRQFAIAGYMRQKVSCALENPRLGCGELAFHPCEK